jgi:LuxR family transcriptional regulator, quorum-sensing system regulator CciR
MTQMADIQAFIDASRRVENPVQLHSLMQAITRDMGFDNFALVHHVDLRSCGAFNGHVLTNEFVALSDYPQAWTDEYVSNEIVNLDPVLTASQRTNVGFCWDQMGEIITISSGQREVFERGQKLGLTDGFTVPANVPGEFSGSCNFVVGSGRALPQANLPMAQLVGSFAFQAARNMVIRMRSLSGGGPVQLTERQLECIALVARGKTDWEIGRILGISEETVKQHMADARQRYDVSKRVQVVLRTLFDGHLPLSEMLN